MSARPPRPAPRLRRRIGTPVVSLATVLALAGAACSSDSLPSRQAAASEDDATVHVLVDPVFAQGHESALREALSSLSEKSSGGGAGGIDVEITVLSLSDAAAAVNGTAPFRTSRTASTVAPVARGVATAATSSGTGSSAIQGPSVGADASAAEARAGAGWALDADALVADLAMPESDHHSALVDALASADVILGLDANGALAAATSGLFAPLDRSLADLGAPGQDIGSFQLRGPAGILPDAVPFAYRTTCVTVDTSWFDKSRLEPPSTLRDLVSGSYNDLVAVPAPGSSASGTAFLLSLIADRGEDTWLPAWRTLTDPDTVNALVAPPADVGRSSTAAGGTRPITIRDIAPGEARSAAVAGSTCYRTAYYAGLAPSADHADEGRAVLSALVSEAGQQAIGASPGLSSVMRSTSGSPAPPPVMMAVDPEIVRRSLSQWIAEAYDVFPA